jgi:hypothetical protein
MSDAVVAFSLLSTAEKAAASVSVADVTGVWNACARACRGRAAGRTEAIRRAASVASPSPPGYARSNAADAHAMATHCIEDLKRDKIEWKGRTRQRERAKASKANGIQQAFI